MAGSVQYYMCIIIKPVTYYTTAKKIYRVTNPPPPFLPLHLPALHMHCREGEQLDFPSAPLEFQI